MPYKYIRHESNKEIWSVAFQNVFHCKKKNPQNLFPCKSDKNVHTAHSLTLNESHIQNSVLWQMYTLNDAEQLNGTNIAPSQLRRLTAASTPMAECGCATSCNIHSRPPREPAWPGNPLTTIVSGSSWMPTGPSALNVPTWGPTELGGFSRIKLPWQSQGRHAQDQQHRRKCCGHWGSVAGT